MSNENSETFIGVNSGWRDARCWFVTDLGVEPASYVGDNPHGKSFYVIRDGVGEILSIPKNDIANLNSLYLLLVSGESKLPTPAERHSYGLLRLVHVSEREAHAFILETYDLHYIRRLGFRIVILGSWAIVL